MSFSKLSALAGVLSLISSVAAHGHVRGITVDGKWIGGWELAYAYTNTPPDVIGWSTKALDNGFVEPNAFGTSDIACHLGAQAGKAFATVAAGSTIEVSWDTWPESHHGPVLDYLAPFGEDPGSLQFFKFAEAGLIDGSSGPGKWASDELIANNNTWTVKIPSDIAPGKYVYRHEIIALHGSGSENGAQNYPQCLNLEITGSGTVTPAGIPATQFYTKTDPGILVSIYQALGDSYVIPGPAVFSGAGAPAPQPSGSAPSTPSPTAADPEYPESPAPTAAPTAAPTLPPYSNSTITAPTSSKSKSACKPKPTTAVPISSPTGALTPVATDATPAQPTVTVIPTPAEPSEGGETSPSPSEPEPSSAPAPSPQEPSESSLPAGTKLSTVLSWLSAFYEKHGAGEYTSETALRRRRLHARQF